MAFTLEHNFFLVKSYFRSGNKIDGLWVYSVQDCMVEFQVEFPHFVIDYIQFKNTLDRTLKLFSETGSLLRKSGSGAVKKRRPEVVNRVEEIMENDPQTSVRHLSQQINLSVGTTHKLLKKDIQLYPYRVTAVQELLEIDYPRRLQFCNWFVNMNNNGELSQRVIFTDEAWFYKKGYLNSQNTRIWSSENPHVINEESLHPEKIGVWAAISQRRIIGPIFFQGTLTAQRYRTEILQPFVNQLHDDELQNAYFQQDGAPCHCTAESLDYLREFFDERIISRNNEIAWPTRSCDLTPCDFFLWPYLKNNIFRTPILNLNDMQQRIEQKCMEINNNPVMLQNIIRNFERRILKCIDLEGQHFQHLL